jgi:hypothetical protein
MLKNPAIYQPLDAVEGVLNAVDGGYIPAGVVVVEPLADETRALSIVKFSEAFAAMPDTATGGRESTPAPAPVKSTEALASIAASKATALAPATKARRVVFISARSSLIQRGSPFR